MLAHVRNNNIIRTYRPDSNGVYKGWVELENNKKVSPPQEGFVDGNDKILPVVEETVNTSTGQYTNTTDTGYQVEENRVYRLISISDMTQQEIDDYIESKNESTVSSIDVSSVEKALATAIYHIGKGTVPNGAFNNPSNFRTWLKSLL